MTPDFRTLSNWFSNWPNDKRLRGRSDRLICISGGPVSERRLLTADIRVMIRANKWNLISTEANFSIQFISVDIISILMTRLLLFRHS